MKAISLSELHGRAVQAHWSRKQCIGGVGRYETDPELGQVLRIHVENECGAFALILQESLWDGEICPALPPFDFSIRLGNGTASRAHAM